MSTNSHKSPASATAAPAHITVTEIELADMLGVSDRRVRQLKDEGLAVRNGPASYDLKQTIRAHRLHAARTSKRRVLLSAVANALVDALDEARAHPDADMETTLARVEAYVLDDLRES